MERLRRFIVRLLKEVSAFEIRVEWIEQFEGVFGKERLAAQDVHFTIDRDCFGIREAEYDGCNQLELFTDVDALLARREPTAFLSFDPEQGVEFFFRGVGELRKCSEFRVLGLLLSTSRPLVKAGSQEISVRVSLKHQWDGDDESPPPDESAPE